MKMSREGRFRNLVLTLHNLQIRWVAPGAKRLGSQPSEAVAPKKKPTKQPDFSPGEVSPIFIYIHKISLLNSKCFAVGFVYVYICCYGYFITFMGHLKQIAQ